MPERKGNYGFTLLAGVLVLVAIYLAFRGESPTSPKERPTPPGSNPPGSRDPHASSLPGADRDSLILQLAARTPQEMPQAASDLRKRARTDRDFMRALVAVLLDPSQSEHVREVVAFVLASLPDPEAQNALLKALESGGDAAWVRTLVLAMGSARDKGRDDTFGLAEGPYVRKMPSGLGVEIRTVLLDPAMRAAVEKQLEHTDVEVRRAVLQVLQHTLLFEARARREGRSSDVGDVRERFIGELQKDAEPSLRAEAGRALAEWMVSVPQGSADHRQVLDTVLDQALKPEEEQVRFRTLQGLKQNPISDLGKVYDWALHGSDFERRAWAIELVASHAETLSSDQQKAFLALAANDENPKLRETVLHQLANFPATPEARELALHCAHDGEWNVRYAAVKALAHYPATPEAVSAVGQLSASDSNEDVRQAAQETLQLWKK
jgi:hypothetical protein